MLVLLVCFGLGKCVVWCPTSCQLGAAQRVCVCETSSMYVCMCNCGARPARPQACWCYNRWKVHGSLAWHAVALFVCMFGRSLALLSTDAGLHHVPAAC